MTAALPYRRLASFYFFHYAALGALVPYWSLYMIARGFSAVETGQVMAIILAGRVVAPTVWGWLADARGDARLTLRLAALCAFLPFACVPLVTNFYSLAAVMSLFSLGLSGVIPQFEATTFNHLGATPERYGLVRLWGSVGFIVSVLGTGLALGILPVTDLPWLVAALLACMLASVWITPITSALSATGESALLEVLKKPEVLSLFLVCFLVQASFGPYYVFFSVFLEASGYGSAEIGFYWALAVGAEIVVFMFAGQLLRRVRLTNLFRFAVGLSVVRWLLTAEFASLPLALFFTQLTHMATFGLYHLVAVSLVHRYFTGSLQVRGQGLYSSLSFGAGGVVGSIFSGYAWQHFGATMTYYLAAAMAAVAFFFTLTLMRSVPPGTREA
ncbi:MAG: MFS transporter [Gammaproteobacteria bacterium]|nr:MFS transporter [Gammaproteobacteria bacterium]